MIRNLALSLRALRNALETNEITAITRADESIALASFAARRGGRGTTMGMAAGFAAAAAAAARGGGGGTIGGSRTCTS